MRRSLSFLSLSLVSALTLPALAEPSAREKAAAEALFQEATSLLAKGKLADACDKFDASQTLDPALGTMLRLADCYDRAGKTASAWALFQEAASLAGSLDQTEREAIAAQRARDLEQRLSKIELRIHRGNWASTLTIRVNGVVVPSASWDSPIPVDPGAQRVEVDAPGKRSFSTTFDAPKGPALEILEIPELDSAPSALAPAPVVSWKEAPRTETGGTRRTLAYIVSGLGIAGLATSGALGYRAYDLNQQSLEQCRRSDATACSAQGKSIRDDAQSFALGSTIAVTAGGALLATGVTLLLLSPSSEEPEKLRTLRLKSSPSAQGARFSLEASF